MTGVLNNVKLDMSYWLVTFCLLLKIYSFMVEARGGNLSHNEGEGRVLILVTTEESPKTLTLRNRQIILNGDESQKL